ncbi:hypothetical protein QZH41_016118 [Actinostola sp. cb2023]|nr:hypothetical protein QZH41_016118 [Actinostola sp. cb2023]
MLLVHVNKSTSNEELEELKLDSVLIDNLVNAGWLQDLNVSNKNLAMQTLMEYFVLKKRKEPLKQFSKGLSTLGVSSLIKSHPRLMEHYFTASNARLTSGDVIGLFLVSKDMEADGTSERA